MGSGLGGSVDTEIGVPLKRAAEIIGVSRTRLLNWGEVGILRPRAALSLGAQSRWLYSLDELAAGRMVHLIEDAGVDIRHLSWMINKYSDRSHPQPLLSYIWGVDRGARKAYLSPNGVIWLDGEMPEQYVMPEVIDLESIRHEVRQAALERRGRAAHVVRKRGREVFEGTRVPVASVRAWIEDGASNDRILAAYPAIDVDDINAVRSGSLRSAG